MVTAILMAAIGVAGFLAGIFFELGRATDGNKPKRPLVIVTVRESSSLAASFDKFKVDLMQDRSRDYVFFKVGANVNLPHEPFIREIA